MKFCIKMMSFIKIGPFLNSAALGGLGGKMAAPGRRRLLERAAWCQNVRTNILVTGSWDTTIKIFDFNLEEKNHIYFLF